MGYFEKKKNHMITFLLKILFIIFIGFTLGQVILFPIDILLKGVLFSFIVALGIMLLNPTLMFLLLLLIRPLVDPLRSYGLGGGLNLLGIFSFFNVLIFVLVLMKRKGIKFFPPSIKWFYFFTIISVISFLNLTNAVDSIVYVFKLLSLIAIFLLSYNLPNSVADGIKILKCLLFSAVIPILYGFYQIITKEGIVQDLTGYKRINATFVLSNPFAFYLGIIILSVLLLHFVFRYKEMKSLFILTGAFICLYFTYVRVVWIALSMSLLYIAIFEKKIRKWVIFLILIVALFFSKGIVSRFMDIYHPPKIGTNSLAFRIEIGRELLINVLPKYYLFGSGIGTSEEIDTKSTKFSKLPHNDYIRVLLETGVFGFIAYIGFLLSMLMLLIKFSAFHPETKNINVFFTGILLFYLITSFGQNCFSYMSVSGYVFCLMGLAIKFNELIVQEKGTQNA